MRVFVTGGAGYIGSHTVLQLLREDHDVLVYDNFCNSSPKALERVAELAEKPVDVVHGDVCDREALHASLSRFSPELVVHFAGLKAVGESSQIPLKYYNNNVSGTVTLLDCMQLNGCSRIVFSSSATVYGDAKYLPFDEHHPIQPANPYGRTKAFVEDIIRDWCASQPEHSGVLLRYFNPVGADASGRIGEDPNGIPNNLMPYIAQVATARLEKLTVFGADYDTRDGTGERDYIHVSDLASAHLAAIRYAQQHTGCEAINVGTGSGATVFEMIKAFESASGKKIPHKVARRRDGDVARMLAEVNKCHELLGWKAVHTLDEMCASTWNWQSQNPDGYPS